MELSLISSALAVVKRTEHALERVKERALASHDVSFEQDVSKLRDDFYALKSITILIAEQSIRAPQRRPEALFKS